ncbi:RNA polymerase sigma factor [Jatrophihabitans sp. YIM 134969]
MPPFESVVAAHGAVVLRVCRAVVGPVDADDAWSETFLSALRAYPRLRPDSDVRAWLVTIAHRRALDVVRARGRAPLPVAEPAPDAVARETADPDPTDPALAAAVAALPDRQRHAVAYRYLADLAYADIAALLGSTEAAARRSAADGIATLRRTTAARPRETS